MTMGHASRFWSLVAALLGCAACKDQEGVLQEPQLRPKGPAGAALRWWWQCLVSAGMQGQNGFVESDQL